MRVKRLIFCLCVFALATPLFSQQITRFAVIDYNRVLQALNVRNNAYTDLEKKTEQVRAELEKRQQEIKDMQVRIEELQKAVNEVAPANPFTDDGVEAIDPPVQPGARAPARPATGRASALKTQEAELNRLRQEILKKTDALKDYYQKRTAELEADRARINTNSASTDIMNQINTQVALTAEGEGYTMVLDKSTKGIVWYSRSVDITDKVIAALTARRR